MSTSSRGSNLFLFCAGLFGLVALAGGQDLSFVPVELRLDDPAGFSALREHRQRTEQELRALMSSHPLETGIARPNRFLMTAAEAEERIRELAAAEAESLARNQRPITGVRLIRSASPYDIGDWVDQDGSRAYRLDLEVEEATAIGFILEIATVPPRAVAFSYAPDRELGVVGRGPQLFIPRPDGNPMYVVPVSEKRVILEIHNLPRDYATDLSKPPPFTISAVVRTPALERYLPLVEDLEKNTRPHATCSSDGDTVCDSQVAGVTGGVLGIETCGSAFCSYCGAAVLKDFDPQTDIPYLLTAGRCQTLDGSSVSLHFREEATAGSTGETNSFHDEISPPLFRLASEGTDLGRLDCNPPDWALLRFNLVSELARAPTFLQGTNSILDSFDGVFSVQHSGGGGKRFSEGHIAPLLTAHEFTRRVDLAGETEYGSEGSPWFDESSGHIWGVAGCGSRYASTPSITATRYDYISQRIRRFLTPRLAQPSITEASSANRIKLGEEVVLRIAAGNTGSYTSPKGVISVAFPDFDMPADASYVHDSAKSPGLTYIERPTGMTIGARDGSSLPANYLHVEAVDTTWQPGESNFLELTIEPQKAGPFEILYRAAMQSENLYDYNDPADALAESMDFDEGWGVRRLVIDVEDTHNLPHDVDSASRMPDEGVQPDINRAFISSIGTSTPKGAGLNAVLSLSPGFGIPGSAVTVGMSLTGDASPAGLQWTMTYSDMELTFDEASPGPAAIAANKSIQCASQTGSTICLVFGVGSDIISDGFVASVRFLVAPTTSADSSDVMLPASFATSTGGGSIPATGTGNTIYIGHDPCLVDLDISDQTLSGVQAVQATNSATLGPNLVIDGDFIVVNAPSVAILEGTGISGTFSVGVNPLCP